MKELLRWKEQKLSRVGGDQHGRRSALVFKNIGRLYFFFFLFIDINKYHLILN